MYSVGIPGLNGRSISWRWSIQQLKRQMSGLRCKCMRWASQSTQHRCNGKKLSSTHVWNRLRMDVTHVGSQLYLAIIDYCPSHFAIRWPLHRLDTVSIIHQLQSGPAYWNINGQWLPVRVDGVPRHVKHLLSIVGLQPSSDDGGDSEKSTR